MSLGDFAVAGYEVSGNDLWNRPANCDDIADGRGIMIGIYNNDDVPLDILNLGLSELSDNPFQIRVDCLSGYHLATYDVTNGLVVTARFLGIGSFQNLSVNPLDLSFYAGTRQTLEAKINTPDVSAVIDGDFRFSLERS